MSMMFTLNSGSSTITMNYCLESLGEVLYAMFFGIISYEMLCWLQAVASFRFIWWYIWSYCQDHSSLDNCWSNGRFWQEIESPITKTYKKWWLKLSGWWENLMCVCFLCWSCSTRFIRGRVTILEPVLQHFQLYLLFIFH